MAILKIARMGHPILARKADPVEDLANPDVARLVADMIDTLEDAGGVGLAAPQVHTSLRVVIFHIPPTRAGHDDGVVSLTVLINPQIMPLSEETAFDFEGCLSIPQLTGRVPRWSRIRYKALDLKGNTIDREASGFHARVVQHECDHLDGILYPMRMTDLVDFGFVEEIALRKQDDA